MQINVESSFASARRRAGAGRGFDTAVLTSDRADLIARPAPDDVLAAGRPHRALARAHSKKCATGWRNIWQRSTAIAPKQAAASIVFAGATRVGRFRLAMVIDCASVQVTREQMSVTISGRCRDYRWAGADRHL